MGRNEDTQYSPPEITTYGTIENVTKMHDEGKGRGHSG